jgi:hypothetical protein
MLPPKECTACGGKRSTNDDPLVCYCWRRTGVAVGWVHQGCRQRLFRGMDKLDDHMRDRGIDVPDVDHGELWEFLAPHWSAHSHQKSDFPASQRRSSGISQHRAMTIDQVSPCHKPLRLHRFRVSDRSG